MGLWHHSVVFCGLETSSRPHPDTDGDEWRIHTGFPPDMGYRRRLEISYIWTPIVVAQLFQPPCQTCMRQLTRRNLTWAARQTARGLLIEAYRGA